ncbi:hypothetical protein [Paraburkholderia phosphatilytica]|uniref:hypothetical protein n=1 Tax=Paraburkholderia phosphatilytica TaxID=2282883 RepID=UPI000F5D6DA4|nr:hypothetical protein [Paraburkholderia phosphatilytica]
MHNDAHVGSRDSAGFFDVLNDLYGLIQVRGGRIFITSDRRISRKRYVSRAPKKRYPAMREILGKTMEVLPDKADQAIRAGRTGFLADREAVSHDRKETFFKGNSVSRKRCAAP